MSIRIEKCPTCGAEKTVRDGLPPASLEALGLPLREAEDARMDLIARNGNGGEHYDLGRSPTPANYIGLQAVLDRAFEQAAYGKGAERHARDLPFDEQPMQKLIDLYGVGFAFGQAAKKMQEAQGMLLRGEVDAAVREMLGAIVYTAGALIHEESEANGA